MAKKRLVEDHVQTQTEVNRRHQDNVASIDEEITKAIQKINWNRRKKAESSFWDFVCTYGYPSLLNTLPPSNARQVLDKMEQSLEMVKPLQISLHRGCGKSVYCQLFLLFQICTLKRRYPVIISANSRAGNQLLTDIFRFVIENDTPFSQDYPTLSLPFQLCNGSYRRRQIYKGNPTNISKTASDMSFADFDIDGQPKACHISARGITSGLRGMRKGNQRVDSILLDDLLGDDGITEETTSKLLDIIRKSVLNLGGANQKLNCTMTSTPLSPDDLTMKLRQDKNWSTVNFPAIIEWGNIESQTFKEYWDMYDNESVEDKPHTESDSFWIQHKDELESGFRLYNPECYTPSENVSGVQALLQKRHLIGDDAFQCEFQLQPRRFLFAIDVSPQDVLSKIGNTGMLELPKDTQITVASIDLNVSHALICSIVCWDKSLTGTVIYHEVYRCHISSSLPELEYQQKVYDLLTKYCKKLSGFGLKDLLVSIDCGGANWNAVLEWCKHSVQLCGLRACGFAGRASHMWNDNVRSKIRTAIGRTVLCGEESTGRKWVAWDSDFGKLQVLKALKVTPYAVGGIMLYNAPQKEHQDWATQVTNERLLYIQHQSNGKDIYHYKSKSAIDHDYLDTLAQAFACAQQNSIGVDINKPVSNNRQNVINRLKLVKRNRKLTLR